MWKPTCVAQISLAWGTPCTLWPRPPFQLWPRWASWAHTPHPHMPALAVSPDGWLGFLAWPWARLVALSSSDDGWPVHGAHWPWPPLCVCACHWGGDGSGSPGAALSSWLFGNSPALALSCHRGQFKPLIHVICSIMGLMTKTGRGVWRSFTGISERSGIPWHFRKPQPGGAMVGSGAAAAAWALGESLGRVTQGRSSQSMAQGNPGGGWSGP